MYAGGKISRVTKPCGISLGRQFCHCKISNGNTSCSIDNGFMSFKSRKKKIFIVCCVLAGCQDGEMMMYLPCPGKLQY